MNELTVVIDETGATPSANGFGVGAILFPKERTDLLRGAAKEIAVLVSKEDFKYKHVQNNSSARAKFIQTLQLKGVRIFGFYSSASGMKQRIDRFNEVAPIYGRHMLGYDSSPAMQLMDLFLGYAVGPIACHALVNRYTADLYWDRRNDLKLIESLVKKHIEKYANHPRLAGAEKSIRFGGQTAGRLNSVARLAGVLAGDLRLFFDLHGSKIWKCLDVNGLRMQNDPYGMQHAAASSRLMATSEEALADRDPYSSSPGTVMLQAYYKGFLKHIDTKRNLISFCDPQGRMGLLEIEHGQRWHVRQSAD